MPPHASFTGRLAARLGRPIDVASLAVFRIAAGVLVAFELTNDLWIGDFAEYVEPRVHFHYPLFSWVAPWPPLGMAFHWGTAIALALAVAAGVATRISAALLCVAWTTLFLMERSEYVNHTYLYAWITAWLAILPVGAALSVDAWRRPERARALVPAWTRGVLVLQMAVVYLFAGIAKLDADWLAGVPQRIWFPSERSLAVIRPLLAHDAAPLAIAWGGIAFDLGIVPALLWRRTRPYAFAVAILFHASNAALLGLASFPWFSIAATTLFLDPSWPRRFAWLRRLLPPLPPPEERLPFPVPRALVAALALYVAIHLALPLRHFAYPGDVAWTEEGHMFAWRMMLRTKTGFIRYRVVDPESGESRFVAPGRYLTRSQLRKLSGQPDMILQFAHVLAAEEARAGRPGARVHAEGIVSLNGRRPRPLVDPSVDLAAERWSWRPWPWILRSPRDGATW